MTREEAREFIKDRHCGNDDYCQNCIDCPYYMAIEALQEIEELQATIDCLEWTIEQLSNSKPKEITKAV